MADITDQLAAALADRYRIERRLGEGGMATVYLADDLKHDRKVAVKVLRPELAVMLGAERFLQEIKTTARLQHPHILPLYDSGSAGGTPGGGAGEGAGFLFYVMPFVEGETLRQRLEREQQLGVDEAVRIASEVADALEYAHQQGVIHRDIKPENILLRNGRALVADFGIALAVSAAGGGRLTETGLSLGTPHYMSPEQATADRHVTNRSDIYSLGSVLFELLAGEPPHTGPSAQAIILKIVGDVPRPVDELRRAVPPHVAAAVAKALEKLPADRFETAKAFGEALHDPGFSSTVTTGKRAAVSAARARGAVPALAAATVLLGALAIWGWSRTGGETPVARYETTLGAPGTLDGLAFAVETAISPDGSTLVFRSPLSGPGQLYIKRRDEVTARPLPGTEGGSGPFFSPDGTSIGFVANGQLRRMPLAGGASIKLADSIDATYNKAAWLDDGSIAYYDFPTTTLRLLRPGDAAAKVIASPALLEGRYPWLPSPLPGSRGILFTAHLTECLGPVSCRPSRVYVYDARKDTVRALFDDAIGAWHLPTGQVLYLTSAGVLMAVPWDDGALAPSGTAVPVIDGIQAPGFQVSHEGTALYLLGRPEFAPGPVPNAAIVWVDRAGNVEPVDSTWVVNTGGTDDAKYPFVGTDWGLALSPDGRRIALSLLTELGTDIWIKPLPVGPPTRLTLHAGVDHTPAWTPDGRAVTFLSDRPIGADTSRATRAFHVWEQAADGVGEPRLVWGRDAATEAFRTSDGRSLLLGRRRSGSADAREVLVTRPDLDSVARTLVPTDASVSGATLSPDARWLAYLSDEQGTNEVFVRPFPDVNGGKWQVSNGGGSAPLWSRGGRELFFVAGGRMQVVRIAPGPTFAAEAPRALFTIPEYVRAGSPTRGTFAVSPDDRRFLMVRDRKWAEMAGEPRLVVVQGFFTELREKMKQ